MKPMFLCSKLAEANESFRGRAAQCEPAAPSQAKAARPSCCMWFVPETEGGDQSFRITVERRMHVQWTDWLSGDGKPSSLSCLDRERKSPQGESKPDRVQRSRHVTCGELGGERVHFFVHHLLVQSPQAERLHCERQGPGQHSVHVHTSEKRHIEA